MSGGNGPIIDHTPVTDCSSIIEHTILNSPNPAVLAKLKINDELELLAKTERGPLEAFDSNGDIAGSITSSILAQLLDCIKKGYSFIAIIEEIDGGKCKIEIRSSR
jgi:hypothetical protein